MEQIEVKSGFKTRLSALSAWLGFPLQPTFHSLCSRPLCWGVKSSLPSTCHDVGLFLCFFVLGQWGKRSNVPRKPAASEIPCSSCWVWYFPGIPSFRALFRRRWFRGPLKLTDLNWLQWAVDWDLILHRHLILSWKSLSHSDCVQMTAGRSWES